MRRRRPRVLAELPEPRGERRRPGALGRDGLETFGRLLGRLGDARAVLVTGSGEGKSELAVGLATAAAAEGGRAALVECDLGAPSLAARLGLEPAPGLHEYLRLEAEAPQIVQPLVLAGPGSAAVAAPLACVVAGRPATDAAALLALPGLAHAIGRLRNAYDLTVVDAPPLSDELALLVVARHADASLACVRDRGAGRRLPVAVSGLVVDPAR